MARTKKNLLFEKIQLLRNASLFSKLREAELEIVAAYSEYYSFNQGQTIFSEGSNAEVLYIIKDGEVFVSKEIKNRGDVDCHILHIPVYQEGLTISHFSVYIYSRSRPGGRGIPGRNL